MRLQTDASFGIIEFSDTTCMFISEPELDRLMKACGQLKGMFAGHRYQQQHQEES